MENNSTIYVLQVADQQPSGPATYEDAQQKVDLDMLRWKVNNLCIDTVNAIYSEIQAGVSFELAAKNHGEEIETPDEFRRNGYVKGLGSDAKALGGAFALTEPGQIGQAIEYGQGWVIFRLVSRTTPDLTDFAARRDSIYNTALQRKQQEMFGRWFEMLIEGSEITNNVQKGLARSSFM